MAEVTRAPFIITPEKRKNEIDKIQRFIRHIPAAFRETLELSIGEMDQYISFNHFIHVNRIHEYYDNSTGICGLSDGYVDGTRGMIYIAYDQNHDEHNHINRNLKIIQRMSDAGVTDWVIDLRSNGGGLIYSFYCYILPFLNGVDINITSNSSGGFMKEHSQDEMLYLMNENGVSIEYETPLYPKITVNSLTIMVNKHSYSCAEWVAHICKKYLGATVIGEITGMAMNFVWTKELYVGDVRYPKYSILGDESQKITPDRPGYISFPIL